MRCVGLLLLALAMMTLQGHARELRVPAKAGALAAAVADAEVGDILILEPGRHIGPVHLRQPVTLRGGAGAIIDGEGHGTVILVDGPDIAVEGIKVMNSGLIHQPIDAGIKLTKRALRAQVIGNTLENNLVGIDIHGARNARVADNRIVGLRLKRMNDRGNGIYVWNAPGTVVENNDIRYGRDGIFANTSKHNIYRNNRMRDLRFAIHYMYTHDSQIEKNVSVGNHLGFAIMYSDRIVARENVSLNDRDYGLMLNYTNQSDVFANFVTGGAEKCVFVYNSHKNLLAENVFDGCDIGIHFTAGSERNTITGNAFLANRTQVKYVGTRDVEWSFDGRGNFWSDHPAFDLNGDGRADSAYRPNDMMDHILWSQPAAKLLMGAPAVQLVRWSQAQFPVARTGGVVDSHPLIVANPPVLPEELQQLAQEVPLWTNGASHEDSDSFKSH